MALTVGRELFIIMRISYSELKSHACVLYYGVKRRHSVSYQRTKGSMKTQQEAEPRPRVPAEVICGAAEQRYIWINLQDFVPLHLRVSWLRCQVLSTVLSFGNLFGDKKKEGEEEGDHEVWERWKATKWEDRKGIERGKKNVTSHHVWALTSILRTPLCCCQTCEDSHLNYLARADYFPRFLSVADASWLVHLQSRWKGGLKINSSWKFKVRACAERKKKKKKFLLEDLNL